MAFKNTLLSKNLEAGLADVTDRLSGAQTLEQGFGLGTNPFKKYDSDGFNDKFKYSNSSYSGTDCTVVVQFGLDLIVLGNVSTMTYSILREKSAVRVLGRSHCKGFTSGGRTVAGSIVFTVFNQHPLQDIISKINYIRNPSDRFTSPVADQLPPLDLILIFHNEYGHSSIIRLFGVEFTQEGQVHSINDLYTENVMEYVARDLDPMVSFDKINDFANMMFERQTKGQFIDNQLGGMLDYRRKLEYQIQQINDTITIIDQELGRLTAAGIATLGLAPLLARGFSNLTTGKSITRADLQTEKAKQARIKSQLLTDLDSINKQIYLHEQNILGGNAENSQYGSAMRENLNRAPAESTYRG